MSSAEKNKRVSEGNRANTVAKEKARFTNVYLEFASSHKTERPLHQQLFQEEL